jgi:hypothetical protein
VAGTYVLRLTVDNGQSKSSSTLNVSVETPPPAKQLDAVYTKNFKINSPLWSARAKTLMVSWIPHCIEQINRTDLKQGPGGIDNFVEAGRKLRGETHGAHKGYAAAGAVPFDFRRIISRAGRKTHSAMDTLLQKRIVQIPKRTMRFPRAIDAHF